MLNSAYWKKRFELLEQSQNQLGVQCYADIERQYRQTQKQIEGQLSAWYQRFAKNNGVTIQEARKMLTSKELEEFKWDINQYIRYGEENAINGTWVKQLENASVRYHISRLEALKIQTQQSLEVMFGNQLDSIDSAMRDIYTNGYYHTAFEIQKGVGVGWNFSTLDEKQISKVINKPWAADGKNFSQRIWGNRQKLINELNTELTRNIILGQDPQKAIDVIARKMKVSKNNAGALVMTEEAFFSSAAQKDCFAELDVEQFEIVATLDSRTSEICQDMDGKHFSMSQWEVGTTAPPFHVRCRSTTVPYFDDDFGSAEERAARGADGKTYYVPADMKYKDWEKAFVEGDKTGLQEVTTDVIMDEEKPVVKKQRGQLPSLEEDEIYTYVSNELEISEDRAIQLTDATMAFTDTYFTDVRRYQQGLSVSNIDVNKMKEISDSVEEYINLAPTWNGGETFRGLSVSDAELASYQAGKIMDGVKDIGGTASWSNTEYIARFYATSKLTYERPNAVMYHCSTQSKGTGIRHISVFEHENEVLCSKESIYEIVKVEIDAENIIHVYLKEVE